MPPIPDSQFGDFLIRRVPRDILDALKAKAAEHKPALSVRWVFIELARKWVEHDRTAVMKPAPPKRKRTPKPAPVQPIPDTGTPDLGIAF